MTPARLAASPVDATSAAAVPGLEIEQILCLGRDGGLDTLQVAAADAWTMALPGLDTFAEWPSDTPPPKICIATEQIAGPVRNGGIGNTYAALAVMLARAGFDVTVLYLRGTMCETMTIAHWVADYAAKGVTMVPVPDYAAQERLRTGADRWLHAPYNMMRWLIDHPMDVVHVSEWRGSAYLCLLAKRQGLAFATTLFLVKTSSPWMWNRLYGARAIEKLEDLAKVHAERRSVELADVVIGGSLHLLRWMASQGYALPRERTFVQPNVVTFAKLEPLMAGRLARGGTRVPIDEFVFFGRLELRKGLFVFCQTIRRLIRTGVALPPRITFMGKPGGRMPSHPDLEADDYLRLITADWPTSVSILTGYQQYDAVKYLLSGPRLAVMPSIIENSSMAVYEAAICGIPCVASDVGGNAELIRSEDHGEVLCQPHPVALGERLERALALGGYVPRPSFDNDDNLALWDRFHRQLGGPLREALLAATRRDTTVSAAATSLCIYSTGSGAALAATLASLADQTCPPHEVLIAVDAETADAITVARTLAASHGVAVRIVEAFDLDAGAGFAAAAHAASGEFVHFLWEGATLMPDAMATLQRAARASGADVLTYLHRVRTAAGALAPELNAIVLGSVSDQFFRTDLPELPLFVRRSSFMRLGGFAADYRVTGHDHEFVTRAMVAGIGCETVLRELGTILHRPADWMRVAGYDSAAVPFRAIRPLLSGSPLVVRDLLLYARGSPARLGPAAKPRMAGAPGAPVIVAAPAVPDVRTVSAPAPVVATPPPVRAPAPAAFAMSDRLRALLAAGDAARDGSVVGQFLGLHEGRLHGWACDLDPGKPALDIAATIDGTTRVHRAKRRFSAWADVPPEALRAGFTIELTPESRLSANGASIALTVADGRLPLAEGVAVPPSLALELSGVNGTCERDADGMLTGWASFSDGSDRAVTLAAYVQGLFLARFRADQAHPSTGRGGFRLEVPEVLRATGRLQIDVVVADTGIALRQSPVRVDGLRVSVGRWPFGWGGA